MLVLSYLGHAYVWGDEQPAQLIPRSLAIPWHAVSERLGRPPVLSYASYALDNWRRFDPAGPVAIGNIAILQNFLGGADEDWFITVHVDIESRAARILRAIGPALSAAAAADARGLTNRLETIAAGLAAIPRDVLEAARTDGASEWQVFRRVTAPLLAPVQAGASLAGKDSSEASTTSSSSSSATTSPPRSCPDPTPATTPTARGTDPVPAPLRSGTWCCHFADVTATGATSGWKMPGARWGSCCGCSVRPGRLVQGPQATGANLHTLDSAINKQGLLVDVGLEASLGMPVGMADGVTAHS
jgi:hypothetical protein